MGKLSRTKGTKGEREAIKVLAAELGDRIGDQLARNLQQTRDGGEGGDVLHLGLWCIEVKRAAVARHPGWWDQAVQQAGEHGIPVIMYRLDYAREWRIRMHIGFLLPIEFEDWPTEDLSGVVEMSVQAFCGLVREKAAAMEAA